MNAEDVGVPKSTLVLGKHSGRHAVQKRCEDLGLALSKFELDRVYRQMTELADRQKHVADEEIVAIVDAVRTSQDIPAPAATRP